MDLSDLWTQLAGAVASVPQSGLLIAAAIAVVLGIMGSFFAARLPGFGRLLRRVSTLGLVAVFVMVVLQVSRFDPRFDIAVPEIGLPEQSVIGGETRIELAQDGHFWVRAEINGRPADFLVDTGATLTALGTETAQASGVAPRTGGIPVQLKTANGIVSAELGTIDSLRFGNIEAQGLDAVIAPNLGKTNVVGMNFLSRLQGWRVEGTTMILDPAPGQTVEPAE